MVRGPRLQGFPDGFVFHGDHSSQYDRAGNAAPAPLAQALAGEVHNCLRGRPGQGGVFAARSGGGPSPSPARTAICLRRECRLMAYLPEGRIGSS
ncbi:MAG: DNA cytosine methyltransferase [Streptosporangiaceae bacterium]